MNIKETLDQKKERLDKESKIINECLMSIQRNTKHYDFVLEAKFEIDLKLEEVNGMV